jgi:hypothetical protein
VNEAYDEEALWQKARLFLNHAMDLDEPRTFDERALWASLALELLAKAALSRVSPVLIALPNEEGSNILIASGLTQGKGTFNSVSAATLFGRCAKAFRPFDDNEAKKIARARNDYLHGGAASFSPIPENAWWPAYWAQSAVLVHAQDKTIEDLVGIDRVSIVEDHLSRNRKNIEHRAEMLVARAVQRLKQLQSGNLPTKYATEWNRLGNLQAGLSYSSAQRCPACDGNGTIEGDIVDASEMRYEQVDNEDWDTWVDLKVLGDYFSCSTCHLVLESTELIEAAGLTAEFTVVGDPAEVFEPEYGND